MGLEVEEDMAVGAVVEGAGINFIQTTLCF